MYKLKKRITFSINQVTPYSHFEEDADNESLPGYLDTADLHITEEWFHSKPVKYFYFFIELKFKVYKVKNL